MSSTTAGTPRSRFASAAGPSLMFILLAGALIVGLVSRPPLDAFTGPAVARTLLDPAAILARWRRAGYTHALVYDTGIEALENDPTTLYTVDDWEAWDRLRADLRPIERFADVYTLVALTDAP